MRNNQRFVPSLLGALILLSHIAVMVVTGRDSLFIGAFSWGFSWSMSYHPFFLPDLIEKATRKNYRFSLLHLSYQYVMFIHRQCFGQSPYEGLKAVCTRIIAQLIPLMAFFSLLHLSLPWMGFLWGLILAESFGLVVKRIFRHVS